MTYTPGPFLDDATTQDLGISAKILNEVEGQRKRNSNRRLALTRRDVDPDGEERGFGLPEESLPVVRLDKHLAELADQELYWTQALESAMRKHPLAAWITQQRGLGFKQLGRLLACLEDPSWHPVEERPRTLPELVAYCGLVPFMRRERGVPRDEADQWSAESKMRLFLISESAIKQLDRACKSPDGTEIRHIPDCRCGRYRLVYEQRRRDTADKLHSEECRPCGPAGKPALIGSPWSLKHCHMDALRYVSKRVLRDLWRESRRINGYPDDAEVSAA